MICGAIRSNHLILQRFSHQVRCFGLSLGSPQSYYDILQVKQTASKEELKNAFYTQSKKLHPDKNPDDKNAPEGFRALVEAYEVLGDDVKRKEYDNELNYQKRAKEKPTYRGFNESGERYRPRYGIDPAINRQVDVDLSEERMRKAWERYKDRWRQEEARMRELEERKIIFRMQLDEKRKVFEHLSEEEKAYIKESMRLFRDPKNSLKSEDVVYNNEKAHGDSSNRDDFEKVFRSSPFQTKAKFQQDFLSRKFQTQNTNQGKSSQESNEKNTGPKHDFKEDEIKGQNRNANSDQNEPFQKKSMSPREREIYERYKAEEKLESHRKPKTKPYENTMESEGFTFDRWDFNPSRGEFLENFNPNS